MTSPFFKPRFLHKPLVKKYKKYRQLSRNLTGDILKQFVEHKSIQKAVQIMGIREGQTLVFDSEEKMSFLMDFNLFEYEVDGQTAFTRYREQKPKLSTIKTEILNPLPLNYLSLFKVAQI